MIQSIRFENFKVFEELDVKLAPLTGIVGPNASGKTSILEGLYFVSMWVASQRRYNHRIRNQTIEQVEAASKEIQLRKRHTTCRTELGFSTPYGHITYIADDDKPGFSLDEDMAYEFQPLFLRLSSARLRQASYSSELVPSTKPDGEGFASALAYLLLSQPELYAELQAKLREVIPSVRRVRFEKAQIKSLESEVYRNLGRDQIRQIERVHVGESLLFDMVGADNIPAALISEGTLLVLAIIYFLTTAHRPALILLDDLDHGLHPKAQRDMVKLIRKLMEMEPDTQIVFTTHSPYLLDCLKPDEVLLTTLRADGSAACRGLTEHPEFEQWKDEMRPGEMWSLFGEDWVANLERNKVN